MDPLPKNKKNTKENFKNPKIDPLYTKEKLVRKISKFHKLTPSPTPKN